LQVALKRTVVTFSRIAEMQNMRLPLKRCPQKELAVGKHYLLVCLFVCLRITYLGENCNRCFCQRRQTYESLKCRLAENLTVSISLEDSHWKLSLIHLI